jgi:hypothetical protein
LIQDGVRACVVRRHVIRFGRLHEEYYGVVFRPKTRDRYDTFACGEFGGQMGKKPDLREATDSGYSIGRQPVQFESPFNAEDKTIANQRLDGLTIAAAECKHCTFLNVSFKEAKLETGNFTDCVFVGCYFRRTDLRDCSFVGCRFIDCRFPHLAVRSCDFRYASFKGCALPAEEMVYSLPMEPNLREELARNLSIEAGRLGLSHDAGKYRDAEIGAMEEHLLAAIKGESSWYREHFAGIARIKAFFQFCGSLVNRWIWGYGNRLWVLLRNWVISSAFVFPLMFLALRSEFQWPEGQMTISALLLFSFKNSVPAALSSGLIPIGPFATGLALLESIYSVITFTLVASYVFRWSLHR